MSGRSVARAPIAASRGAHAASARSEQAAAAPSTTHGHLWALPDGTGLHAPLGRLVDDPDTGRLCCHLCGRWFVSLGVHVRAHGYTADAYRDTMQLLRTRPLVSTEMSTSIATRQARAYQDSAQVRERFAESQQLARTGQLAWRARAGNLESWQRLERIGTSGAQLAAGRATRARRREAHLAAVLAERGAPDLSTFLRTEYTAGASLQTLARTTGLGRRRLRATLTAAGITVRSTGHNTSAGKRSRAETADAVAAARVGTDDLHGWLADRYDQGWSLTRLATAVGHSTHWVRWRLSVHRRGTEPATGHYSSSSDGAGARIRAGAPGWPGAGSSSSAAAVSARVPVRSQTRPPRAPGASASSRTAWVSVRP